VAAAWRVELGKLKPHEKEWKRAMEKRLGSFMRCGHKVWVRKCGSCGEARDGTGSFERTQSCKTKACATCSWVRARDNGKFFERAYDAVSGPPEYRWQYVVASIRYDRFRESDDNEVPGLRERAQLAARVGKALWAEMKEPDAGMQRTIECSTRGHVHLNLVYWGPKLEKVVLEAVANAASKDREVRIYIDQVDKAPAKKSERKRVEGKGSKEGLKKLAEYVMKGLQKGGSHFTEEHLADQYLVKGGIDARLAARWEFATYKQPLCLKYGALRGIEEPTEAELDAVDDEEVACEHCGVVGHWFSEKRNTKDWIMECSDRASPALAHSEHTLTAALDPPY
jgi:hypothetical protein